MSYDIISIIIIIEILGIVFLLLSKSKKINVPDNFKLFFIEEVNTMLVYGLSVGPIVDGDVVKRILTIEVDGELVETKTFEPTATDLGEIRIAEGASVNLALVDEDDAGNVSEPAFIRFVAADTIAPAAPGAFGIQLLREETTTVPVEESTVTPVVEVVIPDPLDMETPNVEVVDPVIPPPVVDEVVEPDPDTTDPTA